ncbi:hypothetical protein [Pseudomonas sp. P105]|uniref:hypothetical protein n=1 Tax=Pseudomonas sp. P105 TaxID=3049542 RepID=UPI0029347576|nr:hypothetical protein [Pseudomonas sp. P105]WNZ81519.1 hypothetical protein QOM08_28530 [Pseudomonas sp. P105]
MTELEQAIIDCAQLHLSQLKGALILPNGPERSDGFTSAWWQLTGLAQLAEFHSGLSQSARDQLRAIDREAAQAVSSNRESSGTAQFADNIAATLADPTTSNWLKQSLNDALARDSVDAANDAELLFELLAHRSDEELRASAHAAGIPETTMAVRFANGRADTLDVSQARHTIITGDN